MTGPKKNWHFEERTDLCQRLASTSIQELAAPDTHGAVSVSERQVRLEIDVPGALETLSLRESRLVQPGPGQLLVRVRAAGMNFMDVMLALGLIPPINPSALLDFTQAFGLECSGIVEACGEGVQNFSLGDPVIATAPGAFASHVRIPTEYATPKPQWLSFEDAAGILGVFVTAHYALNHLARIVPGERVLIHSATGGVGLAALQLCRNIGAEIFATAGTRRSALSSAPWASDT